jgi:GxxExxY protein
MEGSEFKEVPLIILSFRARKGWKRYNSVTYQSVVILDVSWYRKSIILIHEEIRNAGIYFLFSWFPHPKGVFTMLEHQEITEKIIGAAIEIHKTLGPGFIESIYENALIIELRKRKLKVQQQLEIPVKYDGIEVGKHRLDLLVEDIIVVELKAIKNLDDIHFAIVRSYLRATGQKHGLLLNFAKTTLEIKRVIAS